jgi:hypothetical protein
MQILLMFKLKATIIMIYLFVLETKKPNKMKKNLLSLRKLGLVILAAGSMAMYSCGDVAEHVDDAAAHAEDAVTEVAEEVTEEVTDVMDDATCGGGDVEDDSACGGGKCGDGHDESGEHAPAGEHDHDHSEEGHEH